MNDDPVFRQRESGNEIFPFSVHLKAKCAPFHFCHRYSNVLSIFIALILSVDLKRIMKRDN